LKSQLLIFHFFCRLVHSVGKNLTEHGDKIDATLKAEIDNAISEAKSVKEEATLEEIKGKVAELNTVALKIGQAMYGNAKKDDSESGSKPADANEAEYENKEDKK
jgi:molecular chaperone DnaK